MAAWPGIVLEISANGVVTASNGKLDALIAATTVGRPLSDLLDAESSRKKWERIASGDVPGAGDVRWELIMRGPTQLLEPRAFSVNRGGAGSTWLVEHPRDPRFAQMAVEMEAMNSELATVQRALIKEQQRLAGALKELERSNAALDEFAHVASHDLKAPLRAIADYAELLTEELAPQLDTEHRGYIGRIAALSAKMRRMIEGVLEYARAGGDQTVASLELFDSAQVVHDLVDFLAPPADVVIDVADNLPPMRARRTPFEQVFRNLLSNAIKYRREAGARVHVTARDAGLHWEFIVSDNGPGIPASQQERVWRLFHTTRPSDGTGIGLALVKRLVDAQGGSITMTSATEGEAKGTQFRVCWPKPEYSASLSTTPTSIRGAVDVTA
jgi:signal transduction histidine kinase